MLGQRLPLTRMATMWWGGMNHVERLLLLVQGVIYPWVLGWWCIISQGVVSAPTVGRATISPVSHPRELHMGGREMEDMLPTS